MEKIIMIKTRDGVIHPTRKSAEHHIDKKLSKVLCPLAHKLACKKYKDIHNIILQNLGIFLEIKNLQQDLYLEEEEPSILDMRF